MCHRRRKMLLGGHGGIFGMARQALGATRFLRIRAIFANSALKGGLCEPYEPYGKAGPF
jgi:hypothetical protein